MIELYSREAIKKGPKRVHPDIIMIQLMEQMHWTYEDYQNTPQRIIDLIIEKNQIDYKASKYGK